MIEPNRNTTEETLRRFREASFERFQAELFYSVMKLLQEFEMSWDDLADKLPWKIGIWANDINRLEYVSMSADQTRKHIGFGDISAEEINDIAHVFSTEPYLIFRPRFPYINT